jgi:hypothetical protein
VFGARTSRCVSYALAERLGPETTMYTRLNKFFALALAATITATTILAKGGLQHVSEQV